MSYIMKSSTHAVGATFSWSTDNSGADTSRYLGVVGTTLYQLLDGTQFRSKATSGSWQAQDYDQIGVADISHTIAATIEADDGVVVFFGNGESTKITTVGHTVTDFVLPTNLLDATGIEANGKYYLTGIDVQDDGVNTTMTPRAYYLDPLTDTTFTEIPLVAITGVPCYPAIRKAGAGGEATLSVYGYDSATEEFTLFLQDISNDTLGVVLPVPIEGATQKVCRPRELNGHVMYAGTRGIVTYNPDVTANPTTRDTSGVLTNLSAFGDYGAAGTVGAYCANTAVYTTDATTWNTYTSAVDPDEVLATITMPPMASGDVTNFLLRITHRDLPEAFFDQLATLGMTKANFRAEDGVGGDIEVKCISLNTTTKTGYFYILVPTVSSTVDTVVKLIGTYDIPVSSDPFSSSPYNVVVDFESEVYKNLVDEQNLTVTREPLEGADFTDTNQGAYVVPTDPFDHASVGSYMSASFTHYDNTTTKYIVQITADTGDSQSQILYSDAFERISVWSTSGTDESFDDTFYSGVLNYRQSASVRQSPTTRDCFTDGTNKLSDVGHTTYESRQHVLMGVRDAGITASYYRGWLYEVRTANELPSDEYVYLEQTHMNQRLDLLVEVEDHLAADIGKRGHISLERDETIGLWTNEIGTIEDNQLRASPEPKLVGSSQLSGGAAGTEIKGSFDLTTSGLVLPATELLAGDVEFTVKWYQTSLGHDTGEQAALGFRFLDGGGSTISETLSTPTYAHYLQWNQYTQTVQAPANTVDVLVVMQILGDDLREKYALVDSIEVDWIVTS